MKVDIMTKKQIEKEIKEQIDKKISYIEKRLDKITLWLIDLEQMKGGIKW